MMDNAQRNNDIVLLAALVIKDRLVNNLELALFRAEFLEQHFRPPVRMIIHLDKSALSTPLEIKKGMLPCPTPELKNTGILEHFWGEIKPV